MIRDGRGCLVSVPDGLKPGQVAPAPAWKACRAFGLTGEIAVAAHRVGSFESGVPRTHS
jgi:hypothetical protein